MNYAEYLKSIGACHEAIEDAQGKISDKRI